MIGTQRFWRADATPRSVTGLHKTDSVLMPSTSFHGRRSAIASSEPDDVHLTGMSRSLDRRLLALNLKPAASAVYVQPAPTLKVA